MSLPEPAQEPRNDVLAPSTGPQASLEATGPFEQPVEIKTEGEIKKNRPKVVE
jgi:hypothetical protein